MSPSSTLSQPDPGGPLDARSRLIRNAIRYARTTHHQRAMIRTLLRGLDRISDPYLPPDDPAEPPLAFREELRRPATARRRAIKVLVDGVEMPVILNPQGRVDPQRETWLWNYIRGVARDAS